MRIMAELWQFVSRSDMTRDKMSQALEACLGAWGLGLDQCIPLPRFTSSVHWSLIHRAWRMTFNPERSLYPMNQGSVTARY